MGIDNLGNECISDNAGRYKINTENHNSNTANSLPGFKEYEAIKDKGRSLLLQVITENISKIEATSGDKRNFQWLQNAKKVVQLTPVNMLLSPPEREDGTLGRYFPKGSSKHIELYLDVILCQQHGESRAQLLNTTIHELIHASSLDAISSKGWEDTDLFLEGALFPLSKKEFLTRTLTMKVQFFSNKAFSKQVIEKWIKDGAKNHPSSFILNFLSINPQKVDPFITYANSLIL